MLGTNQARYRVQAPMQCSLWLSQDSIPAFAKDPGSFNAALGSTTVVKLAVQLVLAIGNDTCDGCIA